MIWLNATRDKIKSENPEFSLPDISRKAGELWKKMDDKSEWEAKAAKSKEEYIKVFIFKFYLYIIFYNN